MYNRKVRLAIAGAGGRMGRQLLQTALKIDNVVLGAALECEDSALLGRDAGELIGKEKIGIVIQSNLMVVKDAFDVFIDFTSPAGTLKYLEFCRQRCKPMVIGTTGFSDTDKAVIQAASKDIAIVFSANFSVGVNLMLGLLKQAAKIIGNYTDIDIIDMHHRYKVDVPSGTALTMGEVISKAIGKDLKTCVLYARGNRARKRVPGTISFSAIRSGDTVGEHTVVFSDIGERIEITHKASNRTIFANGAIRSALWLASKKNGLFNMQDVMHLYDR